MSIRAPSRCVNDSRELEQALRDRASFSFGSDFDNLRICGRKTFGYMLSDLYKALAKKKVTIRKVNLSSLKTSSTERLLNQVANHSSQYVRVLTLEDIELSRDVIVQLKKFSNLNRLSSK